MVVLNGGAYEYIRPSPRKVDIAIAYRRTVKRNLRFCGSRLGCAGSWNRTAELMKLRIFALLLTDAVRGIKDDDVKPSKSDDMLIRLMLRVTITMALASV